MTYKELILIEESMSKEELLAYAKKIKPLMRGLSKESLGIFPVPNSKIFWIKPVNIRTKTFTWSPVAIQEAEGLTELARVETYHKFGAPVCLKPSIDECIYQCPKEIIDKVVAFEVFADSLDAYRRFAFEGNRHFLTTIYYGGKLPDNVAKQEVNW